MSLLSKRIVSALIVMMLLILAGCGPSRTVSRIETDSTTDLSGRWNDTDSRLTAEALIADCLSRQWLTQFDQKNPGKQPILIVGTIRNLSSEHIPIGTFMKDMEKSLINDGRVGFVASASERQEVRDERLDQQSNASLETMKELAQETGADYMMRGSINTIEDRYEGKKTVLYQVDLELIDMQTNRKVWIGDKKIKKFIEQSGAKW